MLIVTVENECLAIGKISLSYRKIFIIYQYIYSSSRLHDNLNNSHLLPIQHFNQTQRLRKDERDLEAEEENWFNDDGDENKVSSNSHTTVFNDGSDEEDSQPETNGTTSAISTNEPIRSLHRLVDNEDEGLPVAFTEKKSSMKTFKNFYFFY